MITLRQLRYFDALASARHFGRAAERCAVTQPALSMQIRELERELGGELVERRAGDVALTPLGRETHRRTQEILGAVQDLAGLARWRAGPLSGQLKLGIIPSVAPYLLPLVLPALQASYPALDLQVRETRTGPMLDELARGELDCAVLALPWRHPQVEVEALFDDEFLLAVPAHDARRWAGADVRAMLGTQRLLLLEDGHCLRDQALRFCRLADPAAGRSLGATSLATIIEMVAAGYGVTLLPRLCARAEVRDARVALVDLDDPGAARQVGLAWRRGSGLSPDLEALKSLILDHVPRS